MLTQSDQSKKIDHILVGLSLFILIFLLPIIFQLKFQPDDSDTLYGMPIIVNWLLSSIFPASFVSVVGTGRWGYALGQTALIPAIIFFASRFSGTPIRFGRLSPILFVVVVGYMLFNFFGPALLSWPLAIIGLEEHPLSISDIRLVAWPTVESFSGPALVSLIPPSIIAPIYEELLFRGYLAGLLNKHFSNVVTGSLSALIFALSHFLRFDGYEYPILLFVNGIVLYLARIYFGGVGAPIILHMVGNTVIGFIRFG